MRCSRVAGTAVLVLALAAIGRADPTSYTHFGITTGSGAALKAVIFFPSTVDGNLVADSSLIVQRSLTGDATTFSNPETVAASKILHSALGLYEVSDASTDWTIDPSSGSKIAPFYRVTLCLNVGCTSSVTSTAAQAGQPLNFAHVGVYDYPSVGSTVVVAYYSFGPYKYLLQKADDAGFTAPQTVGSPALASQGMNTFIDSTGNWDLDGSGNPVAPYYRVVWCLDSVDPAVSTCADSYATTPAQPSQLGPITGIYEPPSPTGSTVAINFPSYGLGTYIVQRAGDSTFNPLQPTTQLLGPATLPVVSSLNTFLDNTYYWQDDPNNPGSKATGWYRVVWCLDSSFTFNPAVPSVEGCATAITSPPAQPAAAFTLFGYFLPPTLPGFLDGQTTAQLTPSIGLVSLQFYYLGPAFTLTVEWSTLGDFTAPTIVGVASPPISPSNPTITYTDDSSTWDNAPAPATGKATPYYRVMACLASPGGCLDAMLATPATQPFGQIGASGLNIFVTSDLGTPSPSPCGLLQTPCNSINDGIAAATTGNAVYVQPGMYVGPDNTAIDFLSKALTLQSTQGKGSTILSGSAIPAYSIPAAQVFAPFPSTTTSATVVSGFTIVGGVADKGGCMAIDGGSPVVTDCMFASCAATGSDDSRGGAVHITNGGSPTLSNLIFAANQAPSGGCISVDGTSSPTIQYSLFVLCNASNAASLGGGIGVWEGSTAVAVGNTFMYNFAVYGGGVGIDAATITISGGTFQGNVATSFGGGFFSTVGNATITGALFTQNNGVFLGGGIFITGGNVEGSGLTFLANTAGSSGGGLAMSAGNLLLHDSVMRGNEALSAGAMQISTVSSVAVIKDCLIEQNAVSDTGGALFISSYQEFTLDNVTVQDNAAMQGGAMWCQDLASPGGRPPVNITNSRFLRNKALDGGGIFMLGGCRMSITNSLFQNNAAIDSGGAIALTSSVELSISGGTVFENNGLPLLETDQPTTDGGALVVGYYWYSPIPIPGLQIYLAVVNISDSTTFRGNVALDRGGAILVEEGNLLMEDILLIGNNATGQDGLDGVGAGLAISERCPTADSCTTVTAELTRVTIKENAAKMAGGGISYEGGSVNSQLLLLNSTLEKNTAAFTSDLDGVGGGLYISNSNFQLSDTNFVENSAYYGGAIFVAADLSGGNSTATGLNLTGNTALSGPAMYWLHFLSPSTDLTCNSCSITPASLTDITTEIVAAEYAADPATQILSDEVMTPFTVDLLDYYGHVAQAEHSAACVVDALPSLVDPAVIRSTGATEAVLNGSAVFSRLEVTGRIGEEYNLTVTCSLQTLGRSTFLQMSSTPDLAPLPLPVTVSSCPAGSQPNLEQDGCIECTYGQFNFDGEVCEPCPQGAVCPGGADILSQANWWRSSNLSATFYACKIAGVCLPGPEAGDSSCLQGQHGPLCAVCDPEYYKFAGGCKACGGSSQATGMLSAAVILFSIVILGLFARDWDFGSGPGILTKIKIMVAHFQMMALFRDYDLVWPSSTHTAFSYFEFLNVGLSITAPECFIKGSYNFYWFYIFTMALPFALVGSCVLIWLLAHIILKRLDPSGERRLIRKGFVGYLGGLQIRCWKNSFWFVTLLYPRCAMTALQLFGLQRIDSGWYLTADFSIMTKALNGPVSATYIKYMVPGIALLIVFAIVIPTFWFLILWYHRNQLDEPLVAAKYGFLYSSYSRRLPYWETTEMIRKFIIALLPVFIKPQSTGSLQAAVGQIVMVFYIMLTSILDPFARAMDNGLQLASLVVLFLMLLSGAVAKWATLSARGKRGLSAGQLILTCSVGVVLGGAVFLNGVAIIRRFLKNRKQRTAKVASSSEEDGGAPPLLPKDVPLATIRVKAGTGATDDNEGGGNTLRAGYANIGGGTWGSSGFPSPERQGDETPRGDDTPRHGDESPLLKKRSRRTGEQRDGSRRATGGASDGPPLSPRALPPSSTFVANPRVEQWIAGSETSFDKKSLLKHISEKERLTSGGSPSSSRTPRDTHSRGSENPLPRGDPLNLNIRD